MKKYFLHETARNRQSGRVNAYKLSKYQKQFGEHISGPAAFQYLSANRNSVGKNHITLEYDKIIGHAIYQVWNLGYHIYTCPSLDLIWFENNTYFKKMLVLALNANEIWNELNG